MFVAVEFFNVYLRRKLEEITEIFTEQTDRRGLIIMNVNHVHFTLASGYDSADHVTHITFESEQITSLSHL